MRPAAFSDEEIITAGQALLATGRAITGFALRQKLGGGNPNRLKQVWDESLAQAAPTAPVSELPIEVAEAVAHVSANLVARIQQLAIELNDKAVKAADRRVAEVVRTAGEQRQQAERELADAAQAVDELEATVDAQQQQAQEQARHLAKAQEQVQAQAVELAQLRERLAASDDAARKSALTQEQAHAEIAALRAAMEQMQHEVAQAREATAKVSGQLEATQAQNAQLLNAIRAAEANR